MKESLNDIQQKNSFNKQIITTGTLLSFLISFLNIYTNIPLFWGNQGLLPISELINSNHTLFPSIAPLLIKANLILPETLISLFCLIGTFLSTISIFIPRCGNCLIIAIVWTCYLNIFLLGQDLMSFEWDYLLLEVGCISIFLSNSFKTSNRIMSSYAIKALQFVSLKYLLGTGIDLIHSKSRLLANFAWVETLLEKQFFPTIFAYYLWHYSSFVFKKLLAVIGITIFVIAPFGQILFIRRIRLFAGQLIFLYHFSMLFIGNYCLINIICIIANMANFDDEFWRAVTIGDIIKENDDCNTDNNNQEGDNAVKFLKDRHLRGYEDNETRWGVYQELFSFMNISIIFFAVICILVFPIQKIATNSISISTTFFSQQTLNYWMIGIIIYFIASSAIELYKDQSKNRSTSTWIKFLSITICVLIYLSHSMNILYSGLGYAISTKYKGNYFYSFIDFSYNLFNKCHCATSYSQFKELFTNDYNRRDLLIKYLLDNETEWNDLEFYYRPKMNKSDHNLKWMPLTQPRLDWLFSSIASDNSINNNVWLISFLGRVFDKNERLFNALGAQIPQKRIKKIRIESYISGFSTNSTYMFKKYYIKDYLKNIERSDLNEVNKQYHLPSILNETSEENDQYSDDSSQIISLLRKVPLFACVFTIGLICLSLRLIRK